MPLLYRSISAMPCDNGWQYGAGSIRVEGRWSTNEMLPTIILLLVLCSGPEAVAEQFDLSGLQWTLKNQNGSIHIPASGPPSQAHLDLLNAGIITEPLLGVNGVWQSCTLRSNRLMIIKTRLYWTLGRRRQLDIYSQFIPLYANLKLHTTHYYASGLLRHRYHR
jgi:hypothetical protein